MSDNTQEIAKLQYSLDGGESWEDIPSVLQVEQGDFLAVRALAKYPELGWPTREPIWESEEIALEYISDEDEEADRSNTLCIFLQAIPGTQHLFARCNGATATATIEVIPCHFLTSEGNHDLVPGGQLDVAKTTITFTLVDSLRAPVAGAKIHFHLDDQSLGTLSARSGITDANGHVAVEYASGDICLPANVIATYKDPTTGKTTEANFGVLVLDPSMEWEEGPWELLPDGRYRASLTITTDFYDLPLANYPIRLEGWVHEKDNGAQPAGFRKTIHFDPVSGVTNEEGIFTSSVIWDPALTPAHQSPHDYGYAVYMNPQNLSGYQGEPADGTRH